MRKLIHMCLLACALGAFAHPRLTSAAPDDTLLVIVNPGVKTNELSADVLAAIYTLTKRSWPQGGGTIVPFNYDTHHKLRIQFDRSVLAMTPDQAARFWVDFKIRGGGAPPRKVPSVPLMVRVVAQLPGAIGYVPAGTPTEGTRVIARIVNSKVVPVGNR